MDSWDQERMFKDPQYRNKMLQIHVNSYPQVKDNPQRRASQASTVKD